MKVHYRAQHIPLPLSVLSQIKPLHVPSSYFFKINFNIILLFMYRTSFLQISPRNPFMQISLPIRVTFLVYLILFDLITQLIFGAGTDRGALRYEIFSVLSRDGFMELTDL